MHFSFSWFLPTSVCELYKDWLFDTFAISILLWYYPLNVSHKFLVQGSRNSFCVGYSSQLFCRLYDYNFRARYNQRKFRRHKYGSQSGFSRFSQYCLGRGTFEMALSQAKTDAKQARLGNKGNVELKNPFGMEVTGTQLIGLSFDTFFCFLFLMLTETVIFFNDCVS